MSQANSLESKWQQGNLLRNALWFMACNRNSRCGKNIFVCRKKKEIKHGISFHLQSEFIFWQHIPFTSHEIGLLLLLCVSIAIRSVNQCAWPTLIVKTKQKNSHRTRQNWALPQGQDTRLKKLPAEEIQKGVSQGPKKWGFMCCSLRRHPMLKSPKEHVPGTFYFCNAEYQEKENTGASYWMWVHIPIAC